jgi:hypothetical protein
VSTVLDIVQGGFDLAGLVPGIGEIFDGVNAGIYLARGDALNSGLSLAACLPIGGWLATGGKIIRKGIKAADAIDTATDIAKTVERVDDVYDVAKGAENAVVDSRKFTEYIFKDGAAPGKDVVYKNMGYSINDSEALTNIYKEQASLKYATGEYTLGKADSFGQRINIEIELPGIGDAAGKTSYLKSGWMIKPDGSLSLNTPFSGFTK